MRHATAKSWQAPAGNGADVQRRLTQNRMGPLCQFRQVFGFQFMQEAPRHYDGVDPFLLGSAVNFMALE